MSLRDTLAAEREALVTEARSIMDAVEAEARDLSDDEFTRTTDINARIDEIDARAAAVAAFAEAEARSLPAYDAVARVTREERTYNPDADKRGVSFIADVVARAMGDFDAAQRLSRHAAEERAERGNAWETRAAGTGAFAGLTVPQYLTDLAAPVARAGRPVADIANRMALPAEGMTVEISRVTTGTSAAVQATQNSAVSETDIDDTQLSVPVVTISGQQTLSVQAVSRARGAEALVVRDLIAAYNTQLDSQLLNGSGSSGQHRGIRNVTGIISVTYTDSTPTAAEAYPKLFDLIQQVQAGVYGGITHFVMHPRRWAFFASSVGTSFPFLQVGGAAAQTGGQFAGPAYPGVAGSIAGVPVILDGNVVTNLGASTNEDVILGVSADELHLWEDPAAPMLIRAEQPAAASLGVTLVLYGFSAFTAGRYPGAHGTVTGTGLATPSF